MAVFPLITGSCRVFARCFLAISLVNLLDQAVPLPLRKPVQILLQSKPSVGGVLIHFASTSLKTRWSFTQFSLGILPINRLIRLPLNLFLLSLFHCCAQISNFPLFYFYFLFSFYSLYSVCVLEKI